MKWIRVEDRLPEEKNTHVLCFSPKYKEDQSMRYRIIQDRFVRLADDATHWMPLPDPPEGLE
jgi:hypothetical protein